MVGHMREGLAHLALVLRELRVEVPQPHRGVAAASGQALAVGAELHLRPRKQRKGRALSAPLAWRAKLEGARAWRTSSARTPRLPLTERTDSECPGMDAVHRATARTRKTACMVVHVCRVPRHHRRSAVHPLGCAVRSPQAPADARALTCGW